MKKIKTQSGITLVALIITIIVLLILAIVSIRAIQQGGIIGKSQNAVGSYEDKRIEEENKINEYENLIDKYKPITGKAYVQDGFLIIITSDNRMIGYSNGELRMDANIKEIGDYSDMVADKTLKFSKFFDASGEARMALSEDGTILYNFETFEDHWDVESSFVLDESIDISSYLK